MSVNQSRYLVDYGLTNALQAIFPPPIIAKRAPTTADMAQIGQEWIYTTTNSVYFLTSIVANSATWILVSSGGGAGSFASLVVTPGPTSITGTTGINTSGAGVTTIGTGGTGAVNIGNATGNTAITGTLTTSAGITATTGNIVATAGNISTAATAKITGGTLYASGDAGGVVGTTGLSNVANASQSSGALTILSTTASNGTNAGFLKMYLGSVTIFVPYWTNIAP